MPLSNSPQRIIDQLSHSIKEMRDFLLNNPSDEEYYKILYEKINKLTVKANTEGYYNYKHSNPYKTLSDFLNKNNTLILVKKYYSIPIWSKKLIKQSKIEKTIRGGKKFIEWVLSQISKIKPDIKFLF